MPISASLIARGNVVLVESSPPGTSFPSIARRLIDQIPSSVDSKKSYSYESYNFHYLVEGGITYICMSDQALGYRVPYAFLFDLNNRFKGTFGQKVHTAGPLSLNDSFGRVLAERMEFFSNDRSVDKISKVKGDIDDVKKTMVNNIEKVLERNERIEILVDKTDDLHTNAQSFKRKGTKLKRKMWWKNTKLCCCLIALVVFIIVVVIFFVMYYFDLFKFLPDIFGKRNHDTPGSSTMASSIVSTVETLTATATHILATTAMATTEVATTAVASTGVATTAVATTAVATAVASTGVATTAVATTAIATTGVGLF